MRYLMQIAYNGTNFSGYQRQPNKRTVQSELESALKIVFGEEIVSFASGRTDAGVHALGQMAHFDSDSVMDFDKLRYSLNSLLPEDVKVVEVTDGGDIHARYSAKHKRYMYLFYVSEYENPLLCGRALRLMNDVDLEKMQSACKLFKGEHDFKAFSSTGSTAKTSTREIFDCSIEFDKNTGLYTFEVEGNGFLYKMVRYMVGSVIRVGQGKLDLETLKVALDGGNLPKNVVQPPYALYLKSVNYD
ncbi:MAG: tRNA pseudouridine(38-40) synthase TruA [Clostridia bacterium]|nr:tRNA pseudouridine(38-40) synthase TruA [Clostridia bacterium]